MTVAICLSGQPRFIERGYTQIYEKIISKYRHIKFDFFIHTWWDEEMINQQNGRNYIFDEKTILKITNFYKPKGFINQGQKSFDIKMDVDYESLQPISPYSMFYSIKISNFLKSFYEIENNFLYDFVIRCRFDILIEKFDFEFEKLESDNLYCDTVGLGYPNDQFAISDSRTMDYYCSLYDKMDTYYKEGVRNFVGERLLRYHLERNKTKMVFSIKNNIIKI